MERIPILIFTDAPELHTGLARIGRELGEQLDEYGGFKVGHVSCFGGKRLKESITYYPASDINDAISKLPWICRDFSPNQRPILFTITPPSWIFPLACPQYSITEDPRLKWLDDRPFRLWSYMAIEAIGPFGFTSEQIDTIKGCDRVLFYSQFGKRQAYKDGLGEYDYAYHGIHSERFYPIPEEKRQQVRNNIGVSRDDILIGCCMTNSSRKDMAMLFHILKELNNLHDGKHYKVWLHTNTLIKDWNIPSLTSDYDVQNDVFITLNSSKIDDEWLRTFYSSCDITVLPSKSEGFGYPIIESQACCVPCVVNGGGAQVELTPYHAEAEYGIVEGVNGLFRPISSVVSWIRVIKQALNEKKLIKIKEFDWENQRKIFINWLLKGIDKKDFK